MSFLSGVLKGVAKVGGAAGGFVLGGPAGAYAGYQLGSAAGDLAGGGGDASPDNLDSATSTAGGYASADRNRFLQTLQGGQQAVNTSTEAAVNSALPGYMKNLQGSREDAIRRGASNGDLQTSYEGDLASAFQRNIAAGAGAQAASVYGTGVSASGNLATGSQSNYLDLLAAGKDREQANSNNKWNFAAGLAGAAGKAAGAYFGGGG